VKRDPARSGLLNLGAVHQIKIERMSLADIFAELPLDLTNEEDESGSPQRGRPVAEAQLSAVRHGRMTLIGNNATSQSVDENDNVRGLMDLILRGQARLRCPLR